MTFISKLRELKSLLHIKSNCSHCNRGWNGVCIQMNERNVNNHANNSAAILTKKAFRSSFFSADQTTPNNQHQVVSSNPRNLATACTYVGFLFALLLLFFDHLEELKVNLHCDN